MGNSPSRAVSQSLEALVIAPLNLPPSASLDDTINKIQEFEALFLHPNFLDVDQSLRQKSIQAWATLAATLPKIQQSFSESYPECPQEQSQKTNFIFQQLFHQKTAELERPRTPPSLPNFGNTCFLNAALKALFYDNSPYQRLLYLDIEQQPGETSKHFKNRFNLQTALKKLSQELSKHTPNSDEIEKHLKSLRKTPLIPALQSGSQQDSSEFFINLLPLLGCELTRQETKHFFFTQKTKESHHEVGPAFEFINPQPQFLSYIGLTFRELQKGPLIENAFATLFSPSSTKEDPNVTRQDFFTQDADSFWVCLPPPELRREATTPIAITKDILFIPICNDEGIFQRFAVYQLKSAICHGGSLESGHYIAWTHTQEETSPWIRHDDASISYASQNVAFRSISQNSYILHYQRVGYTQEQPVHYPSDAEKAAPAAAEARPADQRKLSPPPGLAVKPASPFEEEKEDDDWVIFDVNP